MKQEEKNKIDNLISKMYKIQMICATIILLLNL